MLYNVQEGKGFRMQSIPGPNRQKVEFSRKSSLDISIHAKELYFDDKANLKTVSLADSFVMILNVMSVYTIMLHLRDTGINMAGVCCLYLILVQLQVPRQSFC